MALRGGPFLSPVQTPLKLSNHAIGGAITQSIFPGTYPTLICFRHRVSFQNTVARAFGLRLVGDKPGGLPYLSAEWRLASHENSPTPCVQQKDDTCRDKDSLGGLWLSLAPEV